MKRRVRHSPFPRNVLNRLFGRRDSPGQSATVDPLDRKMLDLVIGGAKDLRRKLHRTDQHKMDEYLDSLRAMEHRIAAIENGDKHRRENLPFVVAGRAGAATGVAGGLRSR